MPITKIRSDSDGWKMTARTITRNRIGIDEDDVDDAHHQASSQPPKKPEIAPNSTPTTVAIAAAAKPTSSETWPPYMIRPSMSKPLCVGAERVLGARRGVLGRVEQSASACSSGSWVDDRSDEAEEHHQDDDGGADDRELVLDEDAEELPRPRRRSSPPSGGSSDGETRRGLGLLESSRVSSCRRD